MFYIMACSSVYCNVRVKACLSCPCRRCELDVNNGVWYMKVRWSTVVSTARRKLSTPAASSARPSWWRMRATAGCGWAGACAMTMVTWGARLTSSTSSTRDARLVDDALFEFQTLCWPIPSRVLTTSSLTSRRAMSALKVPFRFISTPYITNDHGSNRDRKLNSFTHLVVCSRI